MPARAYTINVYQDDGSAAVSKVVVARSQRKAIEDFVDDHIEVVPDSYERNSRAEEDNEDADDATSG